MRSREHGGQLATKAAPTIAMATARNRAGELELRLYNPSAPIEMSIADHSTQRTQSLRLQSGATDKLWRLDRSSHWYDMTFTRADDARYLRRLAGRIETGAHGSSDPGLTPP